jgi:hypothetical protein
MSKSSSSNPLLLPTSADELPKPQTSRRALTAEQLSDIRHLLDDGAKTPSMSAATASIKGRRVLVPVTSKAVFEGTLEPTLSTDGEQEQFIVHVGNGKFEELTREDALQLFDKQGKTDDSLSIQSTAMDTSSSKLPQKQTIKSALKTKNTQAQAAPSDDGLPLMEIREEWDESNKGLIKSEVVNISKQMERLSAGLKQSKEADADGKQFGEMLVDLLKGGDGDVQTRDAATDMPMQSSDESQDEPQSTMVSDEEYKAIYSRLEELERLEEEEAKKKVTSANKRSSKSSSSGWSKGFLNAKPKKKQSTSEQRTTNPLPDVTQLKKDVKMPMKQPALQRAVNDSKTSKVSFAKDVNVKEISPRAPAGPEPNYFKEPHELDPFPKVETIPFEENVFRGVVKERVVTDSVSMKETNSNQSGEKKLSRFAMQRLERGLK